jgi:acetylornithine aminotransferase
MDVAWFVNSGSEANEAALKIARKTTGRSVMVAMVNGFHGRTMGALGVTWKYREQHAPAHGRVRFVPFGDLEALGAAMDDSVAGIMVEPVQGIAGIVEPPEGYLQGAQELASEHGALLICDEVQCGVGRMGLPLVSRAMGVLPDIVTVGKGVGGGFPVAALLLSQRLAATVAPGEHGTTFGGAPLACAAVEATLSIIESENLLRRALDLEVAMKESLMVPGVLSIRGGGVWIGLTLDRPAKPVAKKLLSLGFLVGTASDPNILRLSPPAVTPIHAVRLLAEALRSALGAGADVAA